MRSSVAFFSSLAAPAQEVRIVAPDVAAATVAAPHIEFVKNCLLFIVIFFVQFITVNGDGFYFCSLPGTAT
jgi:hypothetical protein